jgi:Tol biopolymer transport system component
MSKNGSNLRQVTTDNEYNEFEPNWSPDGEWIVFGRHPDSGGTTDIWIVSKDGKTLINLTDTPGIDEDLPDWRP